MKIAHVDAFGGASGDMMLGALIDAGANLEVINECLSRLGLGLTASYERVRRSGIGAVKVTVRVGSTPADPDERHEHHHGHGQDHDHGQGHDHSHLHKDLCDQENQPEPHEHHHRGLKEIAAIIEAADLPGTVAADALRVFRVLAEAEAHVHGTTIDAVHFHEVGAADAIGDIVGTCAALHSLDVRRVTFGTLPTGRGTVRAAHGELPVPAPATLCLIRGLRIHDPEVYHEMVTPTGAALLVGLGTQAQSCPPMTIQSVGVGAGRRDTARANILRVLVGDAPGVEGGGDSNHETAAVIEANVDDATGQVIAAAIDSLLAAGALDAWWTACGMKKGRPGAVVSCIARTGHVQELADVFFRELPTLGVRHYPVERSVLHRTHRRVVTSYGPVRVKVGFTSEHVCAVTPEYEDCRALAAASGVAVREVIRAATAAAEGIWESLPAR